MATPGVTQSKLLSNCRSDLKKRDILLNCCHDLQLDYKFDTVFIASSSSPEETPKALVWLGDEELVVKSLWRIGVEDRVALTQTQFKTVQDVTGPPSFNAHGSLRIQKLASGVFFAVHEPGNGYLLLGCVHKEARPYPQKLNDEWALLWKECKSPLWDVAEEVLREQAEEDKKNAETRKAEEEDKAPVANPIPKGLSDKPHLPVLDLPDNPNLPKRNAAMVDSVTHLYNRAYFEESLETESERARRYKRNLTLILLLVTHDGKPTQLEEAVLARQAAEILVKSLRRIDILCRVDTFRFAMLLPDTPHQHGTLIARRIFKEFKALMGEKPVFHVNLSAAEFPLHAPDAPGLLAKAEDFMAKAVLAGPNKAVLSD